MGPKKEKSKQNLKNLEPLKEKGHFSINIQVIPGNGSFKTNKVSNGMEIKSLKNWLELITGIMVELQRLSYLDNEDLDNEKTVKDYDIVPNGTLKMTVWDMWFDLIQAVAQNKLQTVLELGVLEDSDFTSANMEYMTPEKRKAHLQKRGRTALMLAAHRGHLSMCEKLLSLGVNRDKTATKRTSLHFVAVKGHVNILELLLSKQVVDVTAVDVDGRTAHDVAEMFGQKSCAHVLFTSAWQERAKKMKPMPEPPLMDHQLCDSSLSVFMKGSACQIYRPKLNYPNEYETTALSSKLHQPILTLKQKISSRHMNMDNTSSEDRLKETPSSYDEWMKSKSPGQSKDKNKMGHVSKKKHQEEESKDDMLNERLNALQRTDSFENWIKKQQNQLAFETDDAWRDGQLSVLKDKGYLREYLESFDMLKPSFYLVNTWLVQKGIDLLDSVEDRPSSKAGTLLKT